MSYPPPPWSQPPPARPQVPVIQRAWFIILASFLTIFLVFCAAIAIVLATAPTTLSTSAGLATQAPTSTATQRPTSSPTAITRPTATAGPQPIENQAILGGLAAYFNQTYPLRSATFDGVSATFTGFADVGTDGQQHLVHIEFTVPAAPGDSQMSGFLRHFMSADAHQTTTQAVQGKNEYDFLSHDLALTFPASAFSTDAGSAAPPGSFSWSCPMPTTCELLLGTH